MDLPSDRNTDSSYRNNLEKKAETERFVRAWYLARLRRLAFASQQMLTPAALVEADKAFVQQQVLESAHQELRPARIADLIHLHTTWLWLAGSVGWAIALLLRLNGDLETFIPAFYHLTIGTLIFDGPSSSFLHQLGDWWIVMPFYVFLFPLVAASSKPVDIG